MPFAAAKQFTPNYRGQAAVAASPSACMQESRQRPNVLSTFCAAKTRAHLLNTKLAFFSEHLSKGSLASEQAARAPTLQTLHHPPALLVRMLIIINTPSHALPLLWWIHTYTQVSKTDLKGLGPDWYSCGLITFTSTEALWIYWFLQKQW